MVLAALMPAARSSRSGNGVGGWQTWEEHLRNLGGLARDDARVGPVGACLSQSVNGASVAQCRSEPGFSGRSARRWWSSDCGLKSLHVAELWMSGPQCCAQSDEGGTVTWRLPLPAPRVDRLLLSRNDTEAGTVAAKETLKIVETRDVVGQRGRRCDDPELGMVCRPSDRGARAADRPLPFRACRDRCAARRQRGETHFVRREASQLRVASKIGASTLRISIMLSKPCDSQ